MVIVCCACLFSLWSCAQSPAEVDLAPAVKERIDSLFTAHDISTPGYAIGISKGDTTLYQAGYGAANLDYDIPITPQSAFSIASVSKQFTAACAAILILEDQLSLEAPVWEFVPELKKYPDTIRVKHLVYNTSGLLDYHRLPRPNGQSWITFNYFDIDECIATSLAQDTLQFSPGDRWDYCNVNFMLLTKIVEEISGMSFGAFARERLFQPLGMDNSLINDDITAVIKNRVTPYNHRTPDYLEWYAENGVRLNEAGDFIQHHRNAPHYGGSGVVTTVEDLLIWSKNMFTREWGGDTFYELMHATPIFNHDRNNQAFGLYHGDFNGHPIVAWDGGDWGISSQMLRFTDQEVAIVVLSNLGSGEAFRKVNQIADILFDENIME